MLHALLIHVSFKLLLCLCFEKTSKVVQGKCPSSLSPNAGLQTNLDLRGLHTACVSLLASGLRAASATASGWCLQRRACLCLAMESGLGQASSSSACCACWVSGDATTHCPGNIHLCHWGVQALCRKLRSFQCMHAHVSLI